MPERETAARAKWDKADALEMKPVTRHQLLRYTSLDWKVFLVGTWSMCLLQPCLTTFKNNPNLDSETRIARSRGSGPSSMLLLKGPGLRGPGLGGA